MRKKVFFITLLLIFGGGLSRVRAVASNNSVFEMRPTNGNDSNGGGFVSGASGTDFSQQNSAQYTFTTLASSNGTTNPCVVSDTNHNFVASDVGNIMQITAGTNWTTSFFQIVSVAANNATLDRACGTAASLTNGTYAVGGALKTFSKLNTALNIFGSAVAWVKAESIITTAATITLNPTVISSGNCCNISVNGYTSSRGDNGQVTIQASGSLSNNPVVNLNGSIQFINFTIDGNNQTTTRGILLSANNVTLSNCVVKNTTALYGISVTGANALIDRCTVTANTVSNAIVTTNAVTHIMYTIAYSNTLSSNAFAGSGSRIVIDHCIAANNTGAVPGFLIQMSQGYSLFISNVAYNNGGDGFLFQQGQQGTGRFLNNISYGNGGFGINTANAIVTGYFYGDYNSYGSNTSGNLNNMPAGSHDVTLTADPFVLGASLNFSLNNTSGGGANLKGVGFPGFIASAVPAQGHLDIGTFQSLGGGGQKGYPIVQ